ncbi:hypothetical protein KIF24_09880 [Micromonospora sp. Llam7]|uniref:hypothetical protein n=1 Tax=Micromonospora tarapacensis TaxID=2835305 RepID=UPI001E2BA065|nr:hypothetical protein [Micromonospora tarapacensis]MBX7266300.1 hypothetical protein [Micromonospora tarapacensis]
MLWLVRVLGFLSVGRDAWVGPFRTKESSGFDEFGFEVCQAFVEEAVVGAGGLQLLLQPPVVLGELANALLERGVLLGEALGGAFGVLGLQVADLSEEDADALR